MKRIALVFAIGAAVATTPLIALVTLAPGSAQEQGMDHVVLIDDAPSVPHELAMAQGPEPCDRWGDGPSISES